MPNMWIKVIHTLQAEGGGGVLDWIAHNLSGLWIGRLRRVVKWSEKSYGEPSLVETPVDWGCM